MDATTDTTPTIDLVSLEASLLRRAWCHEDPAAYREGVRDTLAELRRAAEAPGRRDRPVVAV